ncbi:MAG: hypothetical protein JNL08_01585 [Planctomycetes bacterium]|nr:hypothetical protein [Planctomycetota bacterium]
MSEVRRPQRVAAGWFLGVMVVALVIVAWLRGAGRFVVPLLLAALAGWALVRLVRAIRRPVD